MKFHYVKTAKSNYRRYGPISKFAIKAPVDKADSRTAKEFIGHLPRDVALVFTRMKAMAFPVNFRTTDYNLENTANIIAHSARADPRMITNRVGRDHFSPSS